MDVKCLAQKWKNEWEIRTMVLLSLVLQIILLIAGNRRKYIPGVLVAYLFSYLVAIVTLGMLVRNQGGTETNCTRVDSSPDLIPSFWAPILLVHLGGTETFNAYSAADNELWSRHLYFLATQAAWTFYAIYKSLFKDPLISISIFIAGFIKCGERIWILRSASSKNFRDSENEEMKQLRSKFIELDRRVPPLTDMTTEELDESLQISNIIPEAKYLHEAHMLFKMFKVLVADLVLNVSCHLATYKILRSKDASEAFKLVEVELGFMYDVLYTKLAGVGRPRVALRCISFLCSAFALLVFSLMTARNNSYSKDDLTISKLLLVGVVVLEIYSAIILLMSDWGMLWLSKQRKPFANSIHLCISSSQLSSYLNGDKRWKGSMAQHDLVAACARLNRYKYIWNWVWVVHLALYRSIRSWVVVDENLETLIFNQLLDKRSRYGLPMLRSDHRMNVLKEILAERGQYVLGKEGCLEKFQWATVQNDFHGSLLMWHIATDICYHDDKYRGGPRYDFHSNCQMSKILSNYMMYLLCDWPAMLPKGVGTIAKYRETSIDVSKFSRYWRSETDHQKRWDSKIVGKNSGKNRKASFLVDGCELAKSLQSLVLQDGWENERKWKMISQLWVEMLTYAAINREWKEHARTLTRGGELITHVRLLMAHLGLCEQCLTK